MGTDGNQQHKSEKKKETKSFSDYKVIEMELRKASGDLLILGFLAFGNMTTAPKREKPETILSVWPQYFSFTAY